LSNPDPKPFPGPDDPFSLSAFGDKGMSYLHFGNSLAVIEALIQHFGRHGRVWTKDLLKYANSLPHAGARARDEITDVLKFLAGDSRRKLSLELLAAEHCRSLRWQAVAQTLGCRGFSFRLCEDPVFQSCIFSPDVNRKFALLADSDLYYPPKVRDVLEGTVDDPRNRHVTNSVGWMLVMEKDHGDRRWWYVLNVQSDLMCSQHSALKEQFRGWQRMLFWILIRSARCRGVAMLAVPSVNVVTKWSGRRRAWRPLYDDLAKSFGMRSKRNPYATNIQPLLFPTSHRKCNHRFYVGAVRRLAELGDDRCTPTASSEFVRRGTNIPR
jgi:hypothetical protein